MSQSDCVLRSVNPADGSTVWEGPLATEADVNSAISDALEAQPRWAGLPFEARADVLRRFAGLLASRRSEIAGLIAREIGKPLWEANTEVGAMIGKIDLSIQAYHARCADLPNPVGVTRFRPHGLVAVLGPYNFPGHLPNGHICPALLAGNAVIFKPSEHAPAVAEWMATCWRDAGLPAACLQVLNGFGPTAQRITAHPAIKGIFFTGSARTGKLIARQFADQPCKILALEMGGNNPLIVDLPNIGDIAAAIAISVQSAFLSTGQRCTCARRLIVIDSPQAGHFLERMVATVGGLHIGNPFAEPAPFMGPVASTDFVPPILAAQDSLVQMGAQVLLQARQLQPQTGFISPGILDVTMVGNPPDVEIFGPVLQVIRARDLEQAVQLANATRFGLAAGVISDSGERYRWASARLRAGIINWNQQLTGASSAAPFGGIGDSGNHRPSAYFAADYCAYPVASIENPRCQMPAALPVDIAIK